MLRLFIAASLTATIASSCAAAEVARNGVTEADRGQLLACETDARTIATATEAYIALNGSAPASMSDLVPDWLKEMPVGWELSINADGTTIAVPTPDGPCAVLTHDAGTS